MSTEYRIDVHNAAGAKLAEVTDYLNLVYTTRVNDHGRLAFVLPGDHQIISQLERDGELIVYRRNRALGLAWTADWYGLLLGKRRQYTTHELYTVHGLGLVSLLGRRIVGYPAGTSNRSRFSAAKAETIMKTLVDYNAGSNATTGNGRVRNGAITGLSVQADGAHGNTLSLSCAWRILLEVLRDIAGETAGGDFDVVRTGAATWEFRWYTGQRGTDRTATVVFALDRGNMAEPDYQVDWGEERTVAIVGGQGQEDDRTVVVRTGANYAAGWDPEVFVDARLGESAAYLTTAGDARLAQLQARARLGFKVVQTPGCAYGVHYGLGDLVTAVYGGESLTQQIVGVTVTYDKAGEETIDVEFADHA